MINTFECIEHKGAKLCQVQARLKEDEVRVAAVMKEVKLQVHERWLHWGWFR